ncbi:endonuclease/exonuclease/phosphatase family protein [Streptomyces sp. NPDC017202]|uniref:endonuclease/exonuclease/phosphatase family protein n=1 Tax=Streptomyces sp. NPDC017202 TaxID=3364981 RepID=UPI0037982E9A
MTVFHGPAPEGTVLEEPGPDSGERARTSRPGQGRAVRFLVTLAVLWACYTVLQRLISGRWWVMLAPDLVPPVTFLLVPVLLIAAAGVLALRRNRRRERGAGVAVASGAEEVSDPSGSGVPASAGTPASGSVTGPGLRGRTAPGRRARGTALLLVCCLALVSAAVSWPRNGIRLSALTHQVSSATGDLRVVSWNTTWWGQDVDTDRFWATLRAQRADVYLLQEYIHGIDYRQENLRPVDDLARISREFPGYHVVSRGELITLSRFPVTGYELVGPGSAVADRPDAPWLEVYRAVKTLRVDIRVDGRPLSLYNVHIPVQIDPGPHLVSPSFFGMLRERQRTRTAQFEGLEAELREQRRRGAAAVIAGDFNSSPVMGEMDELRATLRDAADSGGGLYPRTWNELVPVLGLWRLDWAFSTGAVTVDSYRFDDMNSLSDHRAQILEVSL